MTREEFLVEANEFANKLQNTPARTLNEKLQWVKENPYIVAYTKSVSIDKVLASPEYYAKMMDW